MKREVLDALNDAVEEHLDLLFLDDALTVDETQAQVEHPFALDF
jgi:hypothetical protein